jgi:hypothetical protein
MTRIGVEAVEQPPPAPGIRRTARPIRDIRGDHPGLNARPRPHRGNCRSLRPSGQWTGSPETKGLAAPRRQGTLRGNLSHGSEVPRGPFPLRSVALTAHPAALREMRILASKILLSTGDGALRGVYLLHLDRRVMGGQHYCDCAADRRQAPGTAPGRLWS